MAKNILEQGGPPQSTRQGQVPFRCLVDIVDEFRSAEPTLLALYFTIMLRPTNLSAKGLKISLALSPLSFLNRVSKLPTRKLVPQSFHSGQIRAGDIFDLGKVDEIASLGPGTR